MGNPPLHVSVLTSPAEPVKYRLTIDINLMAAELAVIGMDVLKRWMREGKVELVEAERPSFANGGPARVVPAPQAAGARGAGWRYPRSRVKGAQDSGKATFRRVASVVFPTRDADKLNMTEINDVAHMVKHHLSKNELFITANRKDFIDGGRHEALKSAFGVVAMTPVDAVGILGRIEGWK